MVFSGLVFWNGMFILWTFKNIDLIPISSDSAQPLELKVGHFLNFETVVAENTTFKWVISQNGM